MGPLFPSRVILIFGLDVSYSCVIRIKSARPPGLVFSAFEWEETESQGNIIGKGTCRDSSYHIAPGFYKVANKRLWQNVTGIVSRLRIDQRLEYRNCSETEGRCGVLSIHDATEETQRHQDGCCRPARYLARSLIEPSARVSFQPEVIFCILVWKGRE